MFGMAMTKELAIPKKQANILRQTRQQHSQNKCALACTNTTQSIETAERRLRTYSRGTYWLTRACCSYSMAGRAGRVERAPPACGGRSRSSEAWGIPPQRQWGPLHSLAPPGGGRGYLCPSCSARQTLSRVQRVSCRYPW